jgi:hypothetical protein
MRRYHQEIKDKAVALRKKGYSIREIASNLGIAKSTSTLWVRDVHLSISAMARLEYGQYKGIRKGISARQQRLSKVYDSVQSITAEHIDSLIVDSKTKRLLCAFLYWGEGTKSRSRVRIINSDPKLIFVFLKLFRESFTLNEDKFRSTLHLHEYHNKNKQLQFWSKITRIPKNRIGIYLKPHTGKNKKPGYPGCISVNYFDVRIYDALVAYYKLYAQSMGA